LISKLILGLFSVIILFQAQQVYGDEELPIITINFISGNIIDLDEGPQMVRANVEIQNYNPQDGYHFMQVIRLSDGEIIKDTEILPKNITNELFGVQVSHYLVPDENEEELLGDYELRIFSEFGSSEADEIFSIVKSSSTVSSNTIQELVTPEEELDTLEANEDSEIEIFEQSESKIPSWVHDIFIWYADKTISENELLSALEYLIAQGILDVNSN